jgi:hypothetical protein
MTDRSLTLEQWLAEGEQRFGTRNAKLWRFLCPSCGQEQRYHDLVELGVPRPERYMAYSCIGRFNLNRPDRADNVVEPGTASAGYGCTYSGSDGLAPVLLEIRSGEIRRTFEFAP